MNKHEAWRLAAAGGACTAVVWKALSELCYFFRFATYHPTNDWFFKGMFMHT